MNYKTTSFKRNIKIILMNMLTFIPDRLMISVQYRIKTKRKLNWKNPRRFTEKLQLYKLNTTPIMQQCADKYDVRSYVASCGEENILIPIIGVYDSINEINIDSLPQKFVAKDTLGGGGNSVFVCTDKSQLDIKKFLKLCESWINDHKKHAGREHVYDGRKHRVIIEEYLDAEDINIGLKDFKFFCFNGKAKYMYVMGNRKLGRGVELAIKNMQYETLPYYRLDEERPTVDIPKPTNFDEMIKIAEKLAGDFPEVRVDLYCEFGKIYFGELTFFDGSGYMKYEPDEFDYILGKEFILPNEVI